MENKFKNNLRNILILSGAVVLIMFAISTYVWTQIPEGQEVCTHWNAAGECDDYGSKFMGIFLMPIIAIGIVVLFPMLKKIEPRQENFLQSSKAYFAIWAIMLLFFLGLHGVLMLNILGYETNIGTFTPFLVGALLIVIGNYLGKVRSNFLMGIRTPWTLSSDLSWNKTHRLGGKLMVLQGILFMASTIFLKGEAWVYFLIGSLLLIVFGLTIYSYLVWKDDPERRTH